MSSYDAVIFDNDGVLTQLTAGELVEEAVRETLAAVGVDSPRERDVEALYGHDPAAVREVCEAYDLDPESVWRLRERKASRAQQAAMRAGDKPLYEDVTAVRSLDAGKGLVSNNQHETVEFVLSHFGLADQFQCCYGREPTLDGVGRMKPEPYYLQRAIEDLGCERALYVGDSECDVRVARRSGIDSAFLRRSHRRDYDLAVDPTYEVESLHALVDRVSE
ncbi:hypothetical protein BRC83_10465 [Halobacteriales archaeon QS_1_68_17]|nr:MAG: hypothetical protein BRC83_10465 [Halobacteriales archaeon QS_1_68_17]